MKALRYFRKNKKMPDVVVVPITHGPAKKKFSYFEKLVFYRDTSRGGARLLVVSRDIVKDVDGLDPLLGFGEDKLFQQKVFELVEVDKNTKKEFRI